jgi:Mg/Co/Ni transporter MgtE
LDKFIDFDFKWRYLKTVKWRIFKLKKDYIFTEKQELFFNKIDEEIKKDELEKIEKKKKKQSKNKLEYKKNEQEKIIKRNIRAFAKNWKYIELKEYVNNLNWEYDIDDIFLIKKMTEALLNSGDIEKVKNILYRNEE